MYLPGRIQFVDHLRVATAQQQIDNSDRGLKEIAAPLERIEFDATELEIKAVRAGGEPATFETSDGKLRITLPRALLSLVAATLFTCESPPIPLDWRR